MSVEDGEDISKSQNGMSMSFLEMLGFKGRNRKRSAAINKKEEETTRNESKLPILEILSSFITLFLSLSTIHGFAHIIAEKRHPVEILIWLSLMGTGIYGACILSSATWTRYQENPTVVSMERDRFAWNTSFPAATICPSFKINDKVLDNFVSNSDAKNKTALKNFLISLAGAGYKTFDKVLPYFEIPSEKFMDILLDIQFDFSLSVSNSGVRGYKHLLEKTITEMGICYTYNSNLAVYNSPDYWESNSWEVLPENRTFYVHPLDGEIFANVANMSTGFDVSL
ncbi:hypothetical protein ILUMI_11368 [Ignelater luminosus]|uniref:Uncharacterized protein n=1 Tax=Ignelater luminosus TaxID=2038154 RepID=A0A8K0D553_IGNLU|nr:hypothetical protein ILUMI_11368 [Ignelater luminosus]